MSPSSAYPSIVYPSTTSSEAGLYFADKLSTFICGPRSAGGSSVSLDFLVVKINSQNYPYNYN